MTRLLLAAVLAICFLGVVTALPSATFTQGDSLRSVLHKHTPKNVEDAFYLTEALQRLKGPTPNKETLCKLADDALAAVENVRSVYHAVHTAENLNCGKRASEQVADLLFSTVEDKAAPVSNAFYATSAAYRLKARQHLSFDAKKFLPVLEKISDQTTVDGSVKNTKRSPRGTAFVSGLAFQAAALIAEGTANLPTDDEFAIGVLKENLEGLLEIYTETTDGLMFIDRGDSRTAFRATAALLCGGFALDDEFSSLVDAELLDGVTEHILNNVPYGKLEDVYYFTRLMELITNERMPRQLVLTVPKTTFSSTNKGDGMVIAKLTDLLGNAVPEAKVFLLKATTFSDNAVVYSNQQLTKVGAVEYQFNFFAGKPVQGFYSLEYGVQIADRAVRSVTRTIKVATSVEVKAVKINVVDTSDKEIALRLTATPTSQFESFKTSYYYALDVAFTVVNQATNKPTRIQQAFLRFEGANTENSFPVDFVGDSYKAYLDMKNVGPSLLFRSGDYKVFLIVGDPFIDNSFVRELGTIQINFPPTLEKPQPESVYLAKDEIHHKFRQAEKRPAGTVSLVFTGAVFAPILVLVLGIPAVGLSIRIPSGLGFIFTVVFAGVIAAIFAVYSGFWLGYYNMFQALYMTLGLAVLGIFSGFRALRARTLARKQD